MVPAPFQQVYESVCRVLGTEPQPLEPDAFGQLGFGLHLGEVPVHVAATAWTPPGAGAPVPGLLLLVEFGPAEPQGERDVLASLLDANLLLAASGGPVFSRNPVDGCLLLQQTCPQEGMSGERLHALAHALALLARAWREGRLLPAAADTAPAAYA